MLRHVERILLQANLPTAAQSSGANLHGDRASAWIERKGCNMQQQYNGVKLDM